MGREIICTVHVSCVLASLVRLLQGAEKGKLLERAENEHLSKWYYPW